MATPRTRCARGDAGDSLIEILAAMAVLGLAITALMGALGVMATTTKVNRSHSQAESALLSAAEYAKTMTISWPASGCPSTRTNNPGITLPTGFTAVIGSATAAPGTNDCQKLVQIPVQVSGDGFALSVNVVRRP